MRAARVRGQRARPEFLQRTELKDRNNEVPVGFLVVSALAVVLFVGYAVRYLHREQAEEKRRKAEQAQKRANRKLKKGKSLTPADEAEEEDDAPLEAIQQAGGFIAGLVKASRGSALG